MSQRAFDPEIPPDEQLREVSLILMEAMFRLRRHGPPPRSPRIATPPAAATPSTIAPRRGKRTLPKPCHAKQKPGTYANRLSLLPDLLALNQPHVRSSFVSSGVARVSLRMPEFCARMGVDSSAS